MNVRFWYKKPSPQSKLISRPTSKGLIVDGTKYRWSEVEEKWGISGKRFAKRFHANPGWSMEDLLTRPFQHHRTKTRGKNVVTEATNRRRQSARLAHLPEQLEANKVACMRWR